MSAPPERVGDCELAFFFQTNEPIPARPLLTFISEVERIARSRRHLGPNVLVEITEIQTGTKLVRLTFGDRLAVAAFGVAVIGLGNDLAGRFVQPQGKLPEAVAEMCIDNGVVECVITTPEAQIRITRPEIAAVATVEAKRERQPQGRTTFDGEPLPPTGDDEILMAREGRRLEPEALRPAMIDQDILLESAKGVRDGRIYTLVGTLSAPGDKNEVPRDDWQFNSANGKVYIARGVRPDRRSVANKTVVIRAERSGTEGSHIVLMVKDVFETEEP